MVLAPANGWWKEVHEIIVSKPCVQVTLLAIDSDNLDAFQGQAKILGQGPDGLPLTQMGESVLILFGIPGKK
jgi:hypothetical protein